MRLANDSKFCALGSLPDMQNSRHSDKKYFITDFLKDNSFNY